MRRNKRKNTKMFMLILLMLLGIGFAALAANLKINGTVSIDSASWDVHFENVSITQGSVTANPAPTSDNTTTTEMTYAVSFKEPGDFFEFTVDIANDGSIDAMINLVANTTYESDGITPRNLPSYLTSTVTYDDGAKIKQYQELLHGTSEKIKVRIEYKTDISAADLPDIPDIIIFKLEEDYKQKDDNAKTVRFDADFEDDDWDDIAIAYENDLITNLEEAMENGTTREVQLDMDNDGTPETTAHLRIVNMNAPSECAQPGFSRSACGLVLEFVELIDLHNMNPYDYNDPTRGTYDGSGNYGGWEHSSMRNYVNSVIYNALPPELKKRVIDTPVVSSHGRNESDNFYTIDKIYIPSPKELWGSNLSYDSAASLTRQFDYYYDKGTTTSNTTELSKRLLNNTRRAWWTRSATSTSDMMFYSVQDNGTYNDYVSNTSAGISPVFRIG